MAATPAPRTRFPARFPTLGNQLFALASGSTTSVELVRRALDAIEASQPTLNAFRVVLRESALAEAAAADRKRAAGHSNSALPLLGVPIAVKDDVDVAGVPTRFGADGEVAEADADAEVVRRLRAAGAVIVGKTNTCELGQWPFTSGPAFGHTRNPWSREHTPGGSSGGSAAAVAAGLVAAAIGSDGAGSVRIPAAWTHLVGIKPQRGRISTWPLAEAFNGITVNGVLARTVSDAALVLDAVSGSAPGDLHTPPPVQVSDHVSRAPGPLRVALSTKFPFTVFRATLHPEIRAALEAVAQQLEELGHTVVAADPDYDVRMSWNFLARSTAGIPHWVDRLGHRVVWDRRTVANARMGRLLSEHVLRKARAHEAVTRQRIGWIFNLADVVLAPTTALPPPRVDAFDGLSGLATDRAMIRACPATWPWNLLGWPSINVPAGFTSDGLPIGVQLMARPTANRCWCRWPPPWKPSTAGRSISRRTGGTPVPRRRPRRRIFPLRTRSPTRSRSLPAVTATSILRALPAAVLVTGAIVGSPTAHADNKRLNESVVVNVFTIQKQHGCPTEIKINPQLRLAAQWHTNDVLNNRALDGDIGSDGSTAQDRANRAGFVGTVSETVAINPALAISGIEILNQWYYRPDYMAIMSNCANTQIGVWSENSLDRTVVVAVYGQPT